MGSRPLETADLVLQGEVFKDQIPALTAPSSLFSKPCQERPHRSDLIRIYTAVDIDSPDQVLRNHRAIGHRAQAG